MKYEPHEIDECPLCEGWIVEHHRVAIDIYLGLCHEKCLGGSVKVDLETGEPLKNQNIPIGFILKHENKTTSGPNEH